MKVKIGIVGLGEHSLRAHIKHLVKDSRVEIVAAFDPNPSSKDALLSYGINPLYFSDENNFWKTPMDAVVIASPDKFHTVQMKKAIDLGLHIFCEKPMAVSMSDLKILEDVAQSAANNNLVLATCHPRRLDPPFLWLKEQIKNGNLQSELGEILHFDFTFWYKKVEDTPEDEWKKDRSLLSDHFGHEIDALCFLFPEKMKAIKAKNNIDSYNHYEVTGSNTKGFTFKFLGLRMLDETVYEEFIQLTGQKGAWIINLSSGKVVKLPSMNTEAIPPINYDVRFAAVNFNFVDAILGNKKNYLTSEDLLRNNTLSVHLEKNKKGSWN